MTTETTTNHVHSGCEDHKHGHASATGHGADKANAAPKASGGCCGGGSAQKPAREHGGCCSGDAGRSAK